MGVQSWDVFLSHNSKDKAAVREVALRLKEHGLTVWLDEWELVPGRPWQEALEGMVERAKAVAVLVGTEGIGPWQQTEMRAFLAEFVNRGLPVIPVLLPNAPSRVDLPIFLRAFTWVDFREGLTGSGLDSLIWGITGIKPSSEQPSPHAAGEGPAYRPEVVRLKLEQVFRTVGLPQYTYIEPTVYRRFSHAITTPGKHIVLEGASGVGKTCLVFRALNELGYRAGIDYKYVSARDCVGTDSVVSLFDVASELRAIVVDDVHTLAASARSVLANRLKVLSDTVFIEDSPKKFILVGIPTTSAGLLSDALDLGPRLGTFRIGKATEQQLQALIREGEQRLSVRFRDPELIVAESNGSFYLCQHICHNICFNEGVLEAQPDVHILRFRLEDVRTDLLDELHERYHQQVLQFCKGHEWKIEEISGYMALLASLARRGKPVVDLNELLVDAGPYASLVSKIVTTFNDSTDNLPIAVQTFPGLFHYDPSIATFSIEDPAFQYYLTNLRVQNLLSDLGIHDPRFEAYYEQPDRVPAKQAATELRHESVFISYSHADLRWVEQLKAHLAPVIRQGKVSLWSDTQIRAGTEWREEIDRAIGEACVAVLLVSAHYLASDFIADRELPTILERAKSRGLRIVWIPVSSCLWDQTPIAEYQAAIDPGKPLDTLSRAQREKAFVGATLAIRRALEGCGQEPG